MKKFSFNLIFLVGLAFLPLIAGCNKETAPPSPLSAEELPSAMQKSFATAKGEAKDLANQVATAVEAKDYAKAFADIQKLLSAPGLSKDQSALAARAMLTVNELLKTAAAAGDAKAAPSAAALKRYQMTK